MYKQIKLTSYCTLLLLCSGCYMNKAIVQPWSADYTPDSQSDYWTPTKRSKLIKTQVQLDTVVPTENDDLSLAEIINIGLSNNTATQQTWAQAKFAAATYGQTQSSALPSVKLMYEFFRTRAASYSTAFSAGGSATGADTGTGSGTVSQGVSTGAVFIETFNQWDPQLQLTYTLFDFGKNSAAANAARQAMFFADFMHNRTIQDVVQILSSDYYDAIYQRQLLDATQANVITGMTTLDAAQVGLTAGTVSISDVLQAQTTLFQFQISNVEQQQNVVMSTSKLLKDMGLPANLPVNIEMISDANPKEEDIPSLENLLVYAMQSRPDFLAQGADLRSKELLVKKAQREVLPEFIYNLDFGKTYFSGGVNDKYDYVSYFNLSVPLFSGYYYRNNIKQAQAQRDLSEANLKDIELVLVQQVTDARNFMIVSFNALGFSKKYLTSADQQYQVALAEYKSGVVDVLTVISAQNYLADARATYAQSLKNWFESLANLTYALGASTPPSFIKEELQ
ncbi:MAG: TolC family protein [Chlamydiae bacterium]|nr:TolC family protein [Chlamydiota bacterium]